MFLLSLFDAPLNHDEPAQGISNSLTAFGSAAACFSFSHRAIPVSLDMVQKLRSGKPINVLEQQ